MSNLVYDYPKSSCNCYNCNTNIYVTQEGGPSNLSVEGCHIEKFYDCYDKIQIRKDIEPNPSNKGYELLNPRVYTDNFAPEFQKITCEGIKGCKEVYASPDPGLIDVPRGMVVPLDRPPIVNGVKMKDVYDKKYTDWGKNYSTYTDIKEGQIMYYISNSIKDPFFNPNFVSSATTKGDLWKDPMGAMKPQYNRYPIKCNDPIRSKKDNYEYGLSWMDDSLGHRQDIMGLQMRKMNEQRWSNRWT